MHRASCPCSCVTFSSWFRGQHRSAARYCGRNFGSSASSRKELSASRASESSSPFLRHQRFAYAEGDIASPSENSRCPSLPSASRTMKTNSVLRLHIDYVRTRGITLPDYRWGFAVDRALKLLPSASAAELVDLLEAFCTVLRPDHEDFMSGEDAAPVPEQDERPAGVVVTSRRPTDSDTLEEDERRYTSLRQLCFYSWLHIEERGIADFSPLQMARLLTIHKTLAIRNEHLFGAVERWTQLHEYDCEELDRAMEEWVRDIDEQGNLSSSPEEIDGR